MPGPKFDSVDQEKSWFKRNNQRIVLSLIVVLLAVGAYYFYRNYQQRQKLLRPVLQSNEQLTASPSVTPQPTLAGAKDTQKPAQAAVPTVNQENSTFTATAAPGNGATHLARQVLKEYLKDKSDVANQLNAEQKIYIEDYLQKHVTHSNILKVGDKLSFSQDLMANAISQAQKLSASQIKNLHKYVLLVPSL